MPPSFDVWHFAFALVGLTAGAVGSYFGALSAVKIDGERLRGDVRELVARVEGRIEIVASKAERASDSADAANERLDRFLRLSRSAQDSTR